MSFDRSLLFSEYFHLQYNTQSFVIDILQMPNKTLKNPDIIILEFIAIEKN